MALRHSRCTPNDHEVVHQVIALGDALEHIAHESGFLGGLDDAIAEQGFALLYVHGGDHSPAPGIALGWRYA